ncbi:hypothetical protein E2562_028537 [Oryza meyeriana var. granulata]|uniref:Uncharacterized protein n=1 Tax=Oryza meyeriana var. granulata TaxID=110450 RepID=A0A6G1EQQ3_9ORYZ|nr:hypothetical protein E2562_028537 [Oryza meyeriana var. granulata]
MATARSCRAPTHDLVSQPPPRKLCPVCRSVARASLLHQTPTSPSPLLELACSSPVPLKIGKNDDVVPAAGRPKLGQRLTSSASTKPNKHQS